jgi:hypothetical protein
MLTMMKNCQCAAAGGEEGDRVHCCPLVVGLAINFRIPSSLLCCFWMGRLGFRVKRSELLMLQFCMLIVLQLGEAYINYQVKPTCYCLSSACQQSVLLKIRQKPMTQIPSSKNFGWKFWADSFALYMHPHFQEQMKSVGSNGS